MMVVKTVAKRTNLQAKPLLFPFHLHMFHGDQDLRRGWRDGRPLEEARLYKNVYTMAPIISPGIQLIASQSTIEAVPALAVVPKMQVSFVSLYRHPWRPGDLTYRSQVADEHFDTLYEFQKSQPHDSALSVEPYFELLPPQPPANDTPKGESTLECKRARLLCNHGYYEEEVVCPQLVEEYGTSDAGIVHLFSKDLFEQIRPFLDTDFFVIGEADI